MNPNRYIFQFQIRTQKEVDIFSHNPCIFPVLELANGEGDIGEDVG